MRIWIIVLLQALILPLARSQSWTLTSAPTKSWSAIAAYADGTRVVALGDNNGGIYMSTNSGVDWFLTSAPVREWYRVAASADGTTIVACCQGNGSNIGVYNSTNGGVTWAQRTGVFFPLNVGFQAFAASSNGQFWLGAASGPNWIYTSTNYGTTWQKTGSDPSTWTGAACSADGSLLYAANSGYVYASTNGGASWSQKIFSFVQVTGATVATSADGRTLVWATGGGANGGGIFTSTNAGQSWRTNVVALAGLSATAISADGRRMVVLDSVRNFFSTDAGQSWTSNRINTATLNSVASSADGRTFFATVSNGGIYISQPPLLNVQKINGTMKITWPSLAVGWNLQVNSNLSGINWNSPTETVQDNGTLRSLTVTTTNDSRFYRLANP